VALGGFKIILHEGEVEGGPVTDFIVTVVHAATEEDHNVGPQLLQENTKFRQGRGRGGPYDGVFEDDAVVDVTNVL